MGMFDQGGRKKVIIVHADNATKYANFLQQMICNNEGRENEIVGIKDGSVDTVVWSEKEYFAQKPQLSGDSYFIFIGNSKKIEEECYGTQERFSQYGMRYSWFGKRACLNVDKPMMKENEYDSFIEYAKRYQPEIEKISIKKEVKRAIFRIFIPVVRVSDFENLKENDCIKKIKEQQYQCLVLKFYNDGIGKFLGE